MDRKALKVLANALRLRILKSLQQGPKSYSDIMRVLQLDLERDRGKFTYHLNLLREAKLIKEESGLYRLADRGDRALAVFDTPEPTSKRRTSFRVFYGDLDRGNRVVVVFLFVGVGFYLFGATLGLRDGILVRNELALIIGIVLLLLAFVYLALMLYALPGGPSLRWERGLLFALAAGIYGILPLLFFGFSPLPSIALAGVLGFLAHRRVGRHGRDHRHPIVDLEPQ